MYTFKTEGSDFLISLYKNHEINKRNFEIAKRGFRISETCMFTLQYLLKMCTFNMEGSEFLTPL